MIFNFIRIINFGIYTNKAEETEYFSTLLDLFWLKSLEVLCLYLKAVKLKQGYYRVIFQNHSQHIRKISL